MHYLIKYALICINVQPDSKSLTLSDTSITSFSVRFIRMEVCGICCPNLSMRSFLYGCRHLLRCDLLTSITAKADSTLYHREEIHSARDNVLDRPTQRSGAAQHPLIKLTVTNQPVDH